MYYSYLPASQLKRLFSPFMPSEHYSLGLFSLQKFSADELELVGWPGYEMAKRNLDMMDSLMQEVQEFYDNWTKRLDDITAKHEEEQRLQAKKEKLETLHYDWMYCWYCVLRESHYIPYTL